MTLRLVRRLFFLGLGVGAPLFLYGTIGDAGWALWLWLGLMAAALILDGIFWRCPCCGKYLDRNFFASYCPRCGEELDYDQDLRGRL